jgi:hypothetical protein
MEETVAPARYADTNVGEEAELLPGRFLQGALV